MSVVGSDMPPEVREIVDEAGESNCFYYSDRWRQGEKPSVGQAAGEMPNTVPGSPITATQTTDSAKPIAANEGFSFEGDDILPVTPLPVSELQNVLIAKVWDPIASTVYGADIRDPDGNALFHSVYVDAATEIRTQAQNDAGALTRATAPLSDERMASVHARRDGEIVVSARTSSEVGHDVAAVSGTYSVTDAVIGGRVGNPDTLIASEVLVVFRCAPDDPTIQQLRDRMAWRHDL